MQHIHQATLATILLKNTINVRLVIICMAAASVGLSMVIVSIAKLLLLLCGLITLLFSRRPQQDAKLSTTAGTQVAVLLTILAFTLSLFWTVAPQADALASLAKYGKLLVIAFLLALGLFFSATKVRERFTLVKTEVASNSAQETPNSSTSLRFGYWWQALKIIAGHPLTGAGVGSWKSEHKRLECAQNSSHEDIKGVGTPRQGYIKCGTQLGVSGILLFCGLMLSVLNNTLRMEKPYARATQSALLVLGVACLFNSSLCDAMIGDFFCIVIGPLLALGLSKIPNERVAVPQHKPAT